MNDGSGGWSGFDDDVGTIEQVTETILEDVPLDGENGAAPIMPSSNHDADSLVGLRQRQTARDQQAQSEKDSSDVRASLRRQRYTAILDRVVQFIGERGLLPASWLEHTTESGERFPVFVCVIRDNFKRWGRALITTVSFVASLLWLIQWVLGAPSTVMHDGTSVVNLYAPSTVYTVDLTSASVATWLEDHRKAIHPIRGADGAAGYFRAQIYHVSEERNVTLDWLWQALHDTCKHDASDPSEKCVCMPAVEIGVLANAIFVDKTLMLMPRITKESDERFTVTYDDGTRASQPIAAVVEYMHRDGVIERRKEQMARVACIARAIELVA